MQRIVAPGTAKSDQRAPDPPAVWRGSRVRLWDYQPEPWRWWLIRALIAFNEARPAHVPRIDYQPAPERLFGDLTKRDHVRRGILVCCAPASVVGDRHGFADVSVLDGREIQQAILVMNLDDGPEHAPYCHELMHGMTNIDDLAGRRDARHRQRGQSCLLGDLDELGPFDITYLAEIYRDAQASWAAERAGQQRRLPGKATFERIAMALVERFPEREQR